MAEENFKERRKHARLPIINGVLEPVDIAYDASSGGGKTVAQPAMLANLSAGGMRLMTFLEPLKGKILELSLNLPGLGSIPVKGRVSWIHGKGGVYMTGIACTEIGQHAAHKIGLMAQDFEDCDTRVALKLPEACVGTCRAHSLCNKPQKDDSLFKVEA